MSAERVGVVRGILADFERGEFRNSVRPFDAHTLLIIRPEFPEWGAYLGPEAIAGYALSCWCRAPPMVRTGAGRLSGPRREAGPPHELYLRGSHSNHLDAARVTLGRLVEALRESERA
jgi:hypothetical protein